MEKNPENKQISFTGITDGIAEMAEKATDGTDITLSYFNTDRKHWGEGAIESNLGDLVIICNALVDYADFLNQAVDKWTGLDPVRKARFEYHADRCRSISEKISGQIGYNRDAALEKSRKKQTERSDVGMDGLSALMKKRAPAETADESSEEQVEVENDSGPVMNQSL